MSTAKASHYIQVLDNARCTNDWDQVPEWCRKIRKHAPGKKCLALVAETEARLRLIPSPPPDSSKPAIASYIAALNALRDPIVEEIANHPNPPKLAPSSGGTQPLNTTSEDVLQARITAAWISSLKSEWHEVLTTLPGEEEVGEGSAAGKSNYMEIMRVKALILKGIALSHSTSDPSLPLQVYRTATRIPSSYTDQQRALPVFHTWTEKALGQYAMAVYRCWMEEHQLGPPRSPKGTPGTIPEPANGDNASSSETVGMAIGNTIVDDQTVANAFRAHHSFVTGRPRTASVSQARPSTASKQQLLERDTERAEVYGQYFKFLSLILLPPYHPRHLSRGTAPGASRTSFSSPAGTREDLLKELKDIQSAYENQLLRAVAFPKATEYHEVIGEWIDQVMENWKVGGGTGEDASSIVEILYRAARRTFHSPRILRNLFITLTAIGNFSDALAALGTYQDLVEKAKERIAKGHHERDMDSDQLIFQTVVEGIRVICKYLSDGRKAQDIADRMEKWINEWNVRDKDVLAEAYRGIGMARALWSRVAPDGDLRPAAEKAAIHAFKHSLKYDSSDIQSWYGLALAQAETGRIDDAIEAVRRGLGVLKSIYLETEVECPEDASRDYKRWAVPLLHLYALLMTAKEDFEQAERICGNAFDIVGEGRGAVADLGVADKIAVFELEITRLAIIEAVEDSETAIASIDHILTLYSTLFDGTHLVNRQEMETNENTEFENALSSRPETSTSRHSRLLGSSLSGKLHKKKFSMSSTSLVKPDQHSGSSHSIHQRPLSGGFASANNGPAPQIRVTEAGDGSVSDKHGRKSASTRPNSVSGGTMRRMRSMGSMRSKGDPRYQDESQTPPLPSSTEASSLNFVGHVKDPHLFNMLKTKLHRHQLQQAVEGAGASTTSVNLETSHLEEEPGETIAPKQNGVKVDDIPNNLPQKKLPYPINAIGRTLPDEHDAGKMRSIARPRQLPEPKLAVEEERKRVLGALRKGWLCVSGMYRRAGYAEDAAMAIGEAAALINNDGDGEADVFTERGYLAMSQNQPSIAIEFFEEALAVEFDHPHATIGLAKILLQLSEQSDSSMEIASDSATREPSIASLEDDSILEENEDVLADKFAARDRALCLLEKLIGTTKGWNIAEAHYLLSQVLEHSGEIERTKKALWEVVRLEDTTGVRSWGSCCVGVV